MRVAIAGTGRLGVAVIEPLLQSSKHEVVAFVMNGRVARGSKRKGHVLLNRIVPKRESPLPWAVAARIPLLWLDAHSSEELDAIRACGPDLLITCGFSIILKRPLLDIPAIGCINVHSSLLPKHRGPCPFNHVILAGDTESGVTFHVTAEGIDTGAILDQTSFPIGPKDAALDVYKKSAEVTRSRVLALLDRIEAEGLAGTPQDEAQATYDPKIGPAQLRIDWTRSAAELHRAFRSCMPYEQIYFPYRGQFVRVMRASFDDSRVDAPPGTVLANRQGVRVAAGSGTFTVIAGMRGRAMLWPMPWNRPKVGEVLG